jgi:hypothetical protein
MHGAKNINKIGLYIFPGISELWLNLGHGTFGTGQCFSWRYFYLSFSVLLEDDVSF